jgi:hypothetical protein
MLFEQRQRSGAAGSPLNARSLASDTRVIVEAQHERPPACHRPDAGRILH